MNFKFETHPHVSVAWCFFWKELWWTKECPQNILPESKGHNAIPPFEALVSLLCWHHFSSPHINTCQLPFFLTFVLFFQCIDFSEKKYSAVEKLKFPTLIAWLHQLQLMGGTAPHKLIIFDFEFLSGLASWFFCCLTNWRFFCLNKNPVEKQRTKTCNMWHSSCWKKKTSLWKKKTSHRRSQVCSRKNGAKCSQIEDETYKHHVLPYLRNLQMHEEMQSLHIQNLFPSVGQISLLSYWPHWFRKRPSNTKPFHVSIQYSPEV